MILHPPFIITARLLPGLRIGDAFLSLSGVDMGAVAGHPRMGDRDSAGFYLDLPDGTEYFDDNLQSGCGGFGGMVTIFETFLSFLGACAESRDYEIRNRLAYGEGENSTIFPQHIADWAAENADEIDCARSDLCDPEDGCTVIENLIEEDQ